MEFRAAIYMSFKKTQCIVCLNSKLPPPVELRWQNENISKLGILNNQSWQYNYFTNMIPNIKISS
jgi:hypothetical protein